jgi:DNA-binding response OmpR family regulator
MSQEKSNRKAHLANQLVETLMTAAICAEELRTIVRQELDGCGKPRGGRCTGGSPSNGRGTNERPIVDHSTLSLSWAGRSCHLGYTILFRLADRLSRRPNQYVTCDQLLSDVWEGGSRSPDTIRSAVRNLRERLSLAGMGDLAAAIRGCGGRYGLILGNGR